MRWVLKQVFRLNPGVLECVDFVSETLVLETFQTMFLYQNNVYLSNINTYIETGASIYILQHFNN